MTYELARCPKCLAFTYQKELEDNLYKCILCEEEYTLTEKEKEKKKE
jgi:acetyl-CoA carboxylase beta subunit